MGILSGLLGGCLHFRSCFSYQPLPKKDDDLGIHQAQDWIRANPIIPPTLRILGLEESNDYGAKVIRGLKGFYVDSSNEEIVKFYLESICKINSLIRRYLIDHLASIKGDKKVIKNLTETVICTFPPPPGTNLQFENKEINPNASSHSSSDESSSDN